jgi:hypothetical protein
LASPKQALGYWDVPITGDLRLGQWMLNEVALPLINRYEDFAWEILLGYEQQRFLSNHGSRAIATSVQLTRNS